MALLKKHYSRFLPWRFSGRASVGRQPWHANWSTLLSLCFTLTWKSRQTWHGSPIPRHCLRPTPTHSSASTKFKRKLRPVDTIFNSFRELKIVFDILSIQSILSNYEFDLKVYNPCLPCEIHSMSSGAHFTGACPVKLMKSRAKRISPGCQKNIK
jgi:hypothetical protein